MLGVCPEHHKKVVRLHLAQVGGQLAASLWRPYETSRVLRDAVRPVEEAEENPCGGELAGDRRALQAPFLKRSEKGTDGRPVDGAVRSMVSQLQSGAAR